MQQKKKEGINPALELLVNEVPNFCHFFLHFHGTNYKAYPFIVYRTFQTYYVQADKWPTDINIQKYSIS